MTGQETYGTPAVWAAAHSKGHVTRATPAACDERISPLLRDLHWLRVPERIKFRACVPLSQPDCTKLPGERPTVGRHGRLAETTAIGDNSRGCSCVACTRLRTIGDRAFGAVAPRVWNDLLPTLFCTVTGHFQAALKDSSVWTIVQLTTDLVTCP